MYPACDAARRSACTGRCRPKSCQPTPLRTQVRSDVPRLLKGWIAARGITYAPTCPSCALSVDWPWKRGVAALAWIARSAISTNAISGHILDQVLQRPLVARLLALVQHGGHAVVLARCGTRDLRKGAERQPRNGRWSGGREGTRI